MYRKCDIALIMMFTRHPSYIPFELMASKCLVVTNENPANLWLLHDGENCLLSHASATTLCETLERGLSNNEMRKKIIDQAYKLMTMQYAHWDNEMEKIYLYMVGRST